MKTETQTFWIARDDSYFYEANPFRKCHSRIDGGPIHAYSEKPVFANHEWYACEIVDGPHHLNEYEFKTKFGIELEELFTDMVSTDEPVQISIGISLTILK